MSGQEIHKRSDFPPPEPRKRDMNPSGPLGPVSDPPMWVGGLVFAVIAALVVGGIGWWIYAANSGGEPDNSGSTSEQLAKAECVDAVKTRIKHPDTATFEWNSVQAGGGELLIVGAVESQTGFLSTDLHRFTCAAQWSEATESVTSTEILMFNQIG